MKEPPRLGVSHFSRHYPRTCAGRPSHGGASGRSRPAPGPSPSDDKKGTGRQAEPASVTPCGVFLWNNPSGRWLDSTADGLTATAQRIADCVKGDVEAAETEDRHGRHREAGEDEHVMDNKDNKRWANAIVHASMKLPSTATEKPKRGRCARWWMAWEK